MYTEEIHDLIKQAKQYIEFMRSYEKSGTISKYVTLIVAKKFLKSSRWRIFLTIRAKCVCKLLIIASNLHLWGPIQVKVPLLYWTVYKYESIQYFYSK